MRQVKLFRCLVETPYDGFIQVENVRGGDEDLRQEKDKCREVEYIGGAQPADQFLFPFWKNKKEVEKKGGEHEESDFIQPKEKAVERVQLSGRRENIERKEDKRDDEKKHIRQGKRLF